jgi:ketosteroid isomerase-like protein
MRATQEAAFMTIREELDAINEGFGRGFAEQDAARLAGYYTDDARLLFHDTPIIRGRAAIEATMRDWVAAGPQDLVFETGEVLADGDLVVDIGTIVGPSSRTKYVVVYQRQADGSLKIAVDSATRDGPPAAE